MTRTKKVKAAAPVKVEAVKVESIEAEVKHDNVPPAGVNLALLEQATKERDLAKVQDLVVKAIPEGCAPEVGGFVADVMAAKLSAHANQSVMQIIQRLKQ